MITNKENNERENDYELNFDKDEAKKEDVFFLNNDANFETSFDADEFINGNGKINTENSNILSQEENSKNNDIVEKSFSLFQNLVEKKFDSDLMKKKLEDEILQEKIKVLIPIRNLFRRFREIGLVVKNTKVYAPLSVPKEFNTQSDNETTFSFYKKDTDESKMPGIDIVVPNPCYITISVPNKDFGKKDQPYNVHIAVDETKCPYVDLIRNKTFKTPEAACNALAEFFSKNAVKILNKDALQQ